MLAAAGGLAIGAADLTGARSATAVVAFTAIASCTVALPWLLFVVRGPRILGPLGRARDWLRAHSGAVMAAVLGVIGALLVAEGLAGVV